MCLPLELHNEFVSHHKKNKVVMPLLSPHKQFPSLTVLAAFEWRLREGEREREVWGDITLRIISGFVEIVVSTQCLYL